MSTAVDIWQRMLEPECTALLAQARQCIEKANQPDGVAAVAQLRKQHDADTVRIALQLAEARNRAAIKFPDHADRLLADPEGIEQASSFQIAQHKAKRFAALASDTNKGPIVDLCCGIGGDSMALTENELDVIAIDADPVRTLMAQCNAGCKTLCMTAENWLDQLSANQASRYLYHIDPARRQGDDRTWLFADYQPNPAFLRQLCDRIPSGAIKLGPGIDHDDLADGLTNHIQQHELEFISEHGRLVQAVLWTGALAGNCSSRATLLPNGATLEGQPAEPPIGDMQQFLFTVDATAERARLLHVICDRHNLQLIHPALGVLTGNEAVDSPWLTTFKVIEQLPWRPKKVKAWLKQNDGGEVTIKTRGKAVNPDDVHRQLRGNGATHFTLFVLRFDEQIRTLITCRCTPPSGVSACL